MKLIWNILVTKQKRVIHSLIQYFKSTFLFNFYFIHLYLVMLKGIHLRTYVMYCCLFMYLFWFWCMYLKSWQTCLTTQMQRCKIDAETFKSSCLYIASFFFSIIHNWVHIIHLSSCNALLLVSYFCYLTGYVIGISSNVYFDSIIL